MVPISDRAVGLDVIDAVGEVVDDRFVEVVRKRAAGHWAVAREREN
jgi:hypothetical protein